ncbi:MAG TPA: type I glyceraldehyde-3-phosphate dehydrogenase [Coxiellaceae bacterium]|nr:type I glyceraldehyde-3-phosphate dehydrogenase [Coxiellaceae bacterium]
MTIRLAINGYGRIGRNIMRALYESDLRDHLEIVAINDLGDLNTNVHLTKYDSVHGRFNADVSVDKGDLVINSDRIKVCAQRDPSQLPWKELEVDVALECTGFFASKEKASAHLKAGANKVLISAPAGDDVKTIVYGVNHHIIQANDAVISNASCTTNCLAPLVKPLHEKIGVESGLMVTIHAYTNDQVLQDTYHSDLRRARAAALSMIPTKTGAAAAVGLVLPDLKGKLDGYAVRVPTANVSMVDLTFKPSRETSVQEVHTILKEASEGELKNILTYNEAPLVSIDFNHCPASSVFDATLTKMMKGLIKVVAWYDNEWGFSNRMLDTARVMMEVSRL